MSLLTANARLFSHMAAATTAAVLALGIYIASDGALDALPLQVQLPLGVTASANDNYLPNLGPDWGTQNVNIGRLANALSDGTLTVLGSSELSSHDLRFVPYRFFPQELKMPTLAYGHAMFQSYGMLSVLESISDSLTPNTRLVIMVSPAWFASGGQLPRSAFAEHISGPVWDRLWDKPATRDQMRSWISDNANFGLLWLIANGQASQLKDKLAMWWRTYGERPADRPRSKLSVPAHRYVTWPSAGKLSSGAWDALTTEARQAERALSGHNPFDVRDDYYEQFLKPLATPAHNEFSDVNPLTRTELGDLAHVMALLQQHKVRAYFVMQPFNPKLILDRDRFLPATAAFKGMCDHYGMGCLDMYGMPFESGMVRDDMHLAELGWAIANRGIAEYFTR